MVELLGDVERGLLGEKKQAGFYPATGAGN